MRYSKLLSGFLLICFALLTAACVGLAPETAGPAIPTQETTAPKITYIGPRLGERYDLEKKIVTQFVEQTGIPVDLRPGPESATERIDLYTQTLAEQSSEIDVYQIDVIWPGMLADHMLDLNESLADEASRHFSTIVENNTVNGKLVGIPQYTDVGLLYYRTDLLARYGYDAPPDTWAELTDMATRIQAGERAAGNLDFWGYVWSGAAYEGLTCNALEWQVSHGGGRIIEADGAITINNPQAIQALTQARDWVGTVSPPGTVGFQGEDARSIWQAGNAAFMRNWPYAYALGQADDSLIKDQFGVTELPSGGSRHADTLGGWQLAVSKYSQHPDEAIRLVKYLTSPEVQRQRSVEGAFLPTIPDLYDDPDVLAANPFYADLKDVFLGGAVARPSTVAGPAYNQVSVAYFTTVHDILSGKVEPAPALETLETELVELTGFETGNP